MAHVNERLSQAKLKHRSKRKKKKTHIFFLALIFVFFINTCGCLARSDDDKEAANRRKKQKKQERKHSRIARKILKASENGEHYKVLNLKNFEVKLPFKIPSRKEAIYIRVFHPKESDIKKAYRKQARLAHPDKNKSPDANEAFDALDRAAAILLDEKLRAEYDLAVREIREQRGEDRMIFIKNTFGMVYVISAKIYGTGKRILGPFATPVLVLGALIV